MSKEEPLNSLWHALTASEIGASHRRSGLPNQDAVGVWLSEGDSGRRGALAVADGHGSAKSFRSRVGAQIGIDIAVGFGERWVSRSYQPGELSAVKR